MATGKRYYWLKLKSSFMTSDTVDFLMGQKDGANYVVLYQMLCLKTINTNGRLERQLGEIIVPYDEAKIQRDTKWFSLDTIRVALNLYKRLGLVYMDINGTLCLADYDNLVGSETDYAVQKRRQKTTRYDRLLQDTTNYDNANVENGVENFHTEIDIRDRDRDNIYICANSDEICAYLPPNGANDMYKCADNDAQDAGKCAKKDLLAHEVAQGFAQFWGAYPKHKDRKRAEKAFAKIAPDAELLGKMLSAIEAQKKSRQWRDEQYIPYPASWLNGERWNDDVAGGQADWKAKLMAELQAEGLE